VIGTGRGKLAGFAQVSVTGPGLGIEFFTHQKPVPRSCTCPYVLNLCIILYYLAYIFPIEPLKSILVASQIFSTVFIFIFVNVSHCDVIKHT
jgi:hypothetical protein